MFGLVGTQGAREISHLKHRRGLNRNHQMKKRKNTSDGVDQKNEEDKQLATDGREGEHWLEKGQGGTAMWSSRERRRVDRGPHSLATVFVYISTCSILIRWSNRKRFDSVS